MWYHLRHLAIMVAKCASTPAHPAGHHALVANVVLQLIFAICTHTSISIRYICTYMYVYIYLYLSVHIQASEKRLVYLKCFDIYAISTLANKSDFCHMVSPL